MLITKKRYNKIKRSKNQSKKLPKRRKKRKKYRRSFRKRHLDLKRKTLKNRKKRVMKGGSLSEWRNKHPELYTEALSTGIDHRTLENAYRSMTLGMTEGEKISYDKNNLNSKTDTLVNGGNIPRPFQEQVNLMINKQSASDAKKKAEENKGIVLSRPKKKGFTSPPPRGPPTGKEIVKRTQAEKRKREELAIKRRKGAEKRRTAKKKHKRSAEAKKRRTAKYRKKRAAKKAPPTPPQMNIVSDLNSNTDYNTDEESNKRRERGGLPPRGSSMINDH